MSGIPTDSQLQAHFLDRLHRRWSGRQAQVLMPAELTDTLDKLKEGIMSAIDQIHWAFDLLAAHNGVAPRSTLDVLLDYFFHLDAPGDIVSRTQCYVQHMNNFLSVFMKWEQQLRLEAGTVKPATRNKDGFDKLMDMAMNLYGEGGGQIALGNVYMDFNHNGIPKFCKSSVAASGAKDTNTVMLKKIAAVSGP
ncbi:hypothetical protein CALCODRAFT_511419 [Calocera cornea HHB12733]|uniref:Uncharacterized protein n=1 Tax=Calocera cornea HHB12733 TaxID=1353952 RepID=A0A165DS65_9BASI|nr:hypothetical protein CALCODRAFT_511419 [Calocera cornea HHB12733]